MRAISSSRQSLPQRLDRRGIYYGWVVLFAGTVGVIMSIPGQTMGVSVYSASLLTNLGMNRIGLSMAYMFGTLGSALLLPLVGRLLDSRGSRFVGVMASLGLALWLIFLSLSPYVTRAVMSFTHWPAQWAGSLVAFVAFLGIRHFGQGELTIASRTMMARWFDRRRGLMLGISGIFVAFGFGVAPLVLTRLIDRFNWQGSLWVLSGASLLMAAFAWTTFRKSPEAYGLEVDGGNRANGSKQAAALSALNDYSYTASEARKTITFWAFNLGMVAQALLVTAITFHMAHIAELSHITSAKAFSVFLPIAFVSVIAEFIGGVLSDRIRLKYLLSFMQLGICCGLFGLQFFGAPLGFALTALGFGISNGLFSLFTAVAWAKLFGTGNLGAISGVNMSWIVAGSAVGPYLFSLGESATRNYHLVIYLSMAIPLAVFVGSLFANAPEKRRQVSSNEELLVSREA